MDRGAFLDRLRAQLASSDDPYSRAHPLPPDDGDHIPRMRWLADDRPMSEVFTASLENHGGQARELGSDGALARFLREVVETHGIRSAVVTAEPATEGVADVMSALGVEVRPFSSVAAAEADLGITGAVAAIARTGTVVVDTAAAGGRSASLLPDVHVALVRRTQLIDTPSDLWTSVPDRYGDGMPSQVVLITGPSKSADIEGALTVGVHGPRAIWVGLLTH